MENTNTLTGLVKQSQELIAILTESEGQIIPEVQGLIKVEDVELPAKIDGYAIFIERLEMEQSYWKAKADECDRIAKNCEGTRDFLRERLKMAAIALEKTELKGNDFKVTIYNSKPSVIVNEEMLDRAYFKEVITHKVDKKKIEEDLSMGVPVVGAILKESKAMRISMSRKAGA